MKKILVIDHDPYSRTVLKDNLDGVYQVFDVASGTEAIDLAHRQPPDLMLLDVQMSEGSGAEFCTILIDTIATQ